ncbi:MAG: transcription termination factor NusA [Symploca sp. SIO1B1]|nr:transcription termination factor NusA [Symploca sp. SIO1B1]
MSRDIDIDEQELAKFIDVLSSFQDLTIDKFQAVESAWLTCDESWKGDSKEKFTKDFQETTETVKKSLEVGDDALDWLRRFDEILKDFEQNY